MMAMTHHFSVMIALRLWLKFFSSLCQRTQNSENAMMKCSMLHRQTVSRLSTVYQAIATRFSSGIDAMGK